MDNFPTIKGHGHIKINDTIIPFENKVNSWFLGAPTFFLDYVGLTKQQSSTTTYGRSFTKFSVVQEPIDNNMRKVYTEMGIILANAFSLVQSSMYRTTIRGAGTIQRDGIIRGAGFDITTLIPINVTPYVSLNIKQVTMNVPTGTYTLPSTSSWVYHPTKKALYCFTNPNIYKLSYDIDTGIFGNLTIVSTNWGTMYSSGFDCTDLRNRRFMMVSTSQFLIWDFISETVTVVGFNRLVGSCQWGVGWDNQKQVIRSIGNANVDNVNRNGLEIELNGNVNVNTGWYNSETQYILDFKDNYWLGHTGIFPYATNTGSAIRLANLNTTVSWGFDRRLTIFDNLDVCVTATFNNTSPSNVTFTMIKYPDTSMTLLQMPETIVTTGDPFSIEYTFDIIDGR
jgi:hypothetical protein